MQHYHHQNFHQRLEGNIFKNKKISFTANKWYTFVIISITYLILISVKYLLSLSDPTILLIAGHFRQGNWETDTHACWSVNLGSLASNHSVLRHLYLFYSLTVSTFSLCLGYLIPGILALGYSPIYRWCLMIKPTYLLGQAKVKIVLKRRILRFLP